VTTRVGGRSRHVISISRPCWRSRLRTSQSAGVRLTRPMSRRRRGTETASYIAVLERDVTLDEYVEGAPARVPQCPGIRVINRLPQTDVSLVRSGAMTLTS